MCSFNTNGKSPEQAKQLNDFDMLSGTGRQVRPKELTSSVLQALGPIDPAPQQLLDGAAEQHDEEEDEQYSDIDGPEWDPETTTKEGANADEDCNIGRLVIKPQVNPQSGLHSVPRGTDSHTSKFFGSPVTQKMYEPL